MSALYDSFCMSLDIAVNYPSNQPAFEVVLAKLQTLFSDYSFGLPSASPMTNEDHATLMEKISKNGKNVQADYDAISGSILQIQRVSFMNEDQIRSVARTLFAKYRLSPAVLANPGSNVSQEDQTVQNMEAALQKASMNALLAELRHMETEHARLKANLEHDKSVRAKSAALEAFRKAKDAANEARANALKRKRE